MSKVKKEQAISKIKSTAALEVSLIVIKRDAPRIHSFLLYKSPVQFEMEVQLNPELLILRQKFLN